MNEIQNISISGKLIKKIENIKSSYSSKLNPLSKPTEDSVEISGKSDILSVISKGGDNLPDDWISKTFKFDWTSVRTIIIENINKLVLKAKDLVDQAIYVVPNKLVDTLIIKLLDICEDFVKNTIMPLDEVLNEVAKRYNYIIRKWRELKKISKEVKEGLKTENDKKQLIKEISNDLSKLDENISLLITILMIVDIIDDLCDNIKNMFSSENGSWTRLLNKTKDLFSILDEIKNKSKNLQVLHNLIKVLLPIIASLAAAILCANKTDAKIRKTSAKSRDEELKNLGIDPENLNSEKEQKKLEDLYRNLSILLEYGLRNIYGYSMKYDSSGNLIDEKNVNNEVDSEEIISICQVKDLSDGLSKKFEESEHKPRYILELGKDLSGAYFIVNKGNYISNDQIIGYYQNIPIKSKVAGIVLDKKLRHIIVESQISANNIENECQKIADNIDLTDKFSPIVDEFKKMNNLETYLMDYALPCRYPNLMLHSSKNGSYSINLLDLLKGKVKNSKYRLIDDYNEAVDKVTNNYKNKIKDICSADNVKTSCENNQNDKLKDQILNVKKQGIKDIVQFYKTWIPSTTHKCKDEADTYLLVSDYINYLSGDNFIYDDDNPYVVELFNDINNFIKDRMKSESIDKKSLLKEFNNRCKNLLYSKIKTSDYYSYFSKLFGSDWYIQDDDRIIGISKYNMKSGESYDSLYKKMYNHILNIIGSKSVSRGSETFDPEKITDINAFLKDNKFSSDFDKKDKLILENQNKAKSITKYYMILKNLSVNNYNVNNTVNLKNKTKSEADILDKLTNKVISEYNSPKYANFYNNIEDHFKQFISVECPYQGILYINNYEHEHYVYSKIMDTEMNPYNAHATDEELFDRLSSKTGCSPFQLPYWLIYCAQATLVNVLVPIYWSTGLLIAGVPILLPIIYVPIYYMNGSVGVLFGLGICGIAIWPMMVFVNNTAYQSTTLLPITIALDFIKKTLRELANSSTKTISLTAKPLINVCDTEIYELEKQLDDLKIQISQQKNNMAKVDFSKVKEEQIPKLSESLNLSNSINDIFNRSYNLNIQENISNDIVSNIDNYRYDLNEDSSIDDGLYHNVVVFLDPASGDKENENMSPFTKNGVYPNGWQETKKPDEKILKFNEYQWSSEICKNIKSSLEPYGIKVIITANNNSSKISDKLSKVYSNSKNSKKHHLMISIRVNSIDPDDKKWKTGISGWSIYTSRLYSTIPYYKDSVDLAELIYDAAIPKFKNKGMNLLTSMNGNWISEKNDYYKKYKIRHQEEDYAILQNAIEKNNNMQMMPTVMSKNFYCDNIEDLQYLNSAAGKADIAMVHVNGILKFINSKGWR